ncbi:hypothetical protein [Deinococcus cellulosilyticus]|nr:hypothetical protein [Deinococcus cellulosilyticus]
MTKLFYRFTFKVWRDRMRQLDSPTLKPPPDGPGSKARTEPHLSDNVS